MAITPTKLRIIADWLEEEEMDIHWGCCGQTVQDELREWARQLDEQEIPLPQKALWRHFSVGDWVSIAFFLGSAFGMLVFLMLEKGGT